MAEICVAMHPGFTRGLFPLVLQFSVPTSGGLPWPFDTCDNATTTAASRLVLEKTIGLTDQDLFVPEPPFTDPMTEDPAGWLECMALHYSGVRKMTGEMAEIYLAENQKI